MFELIMGRVVGNGRVRLKEEEGEEAAVDADYF